MQITAFNPMILSKNAEEIIKLFEELGFERRHQMDNIDGMDISNVRMTDPNGFRVDVARVEFMEKDMTTMIMNVRDFDEAYEFLKSHEFKNVRGKDHIVESESARSCQMIAPSGFSIQLTQHIRKEE
ncbi:MAG: hypothetical protein PUB12_06285 [[Clostridium] aminophilum]|uniref:hypothetical protein n=1 Tax=[Clostridium] aminophilum TaxID=1526 RepID=UPI0026EBFFC2|nr:hypothetical protein [[Clostridium] aminophilum]MDD6196478.1 hypothetical protein [[Clostridium] aminophilum]